MDSILLVSSSEKSVTFFLETLSGLDAELYTARTLRQAREIFLREKIDLCLVNSPLEDGDGESFACDAVSVGLTQVILLVRAEAAPAVSERCAERGIFTLAKPVGKKSLLMALSFAGVSRQRLGMMQQTNTKLMGQVQELRLVARAKCILVQYLNMTEAQAHRYIEKQAMDMRLTRQKVAENILKTYES